MFSLLHNEQARLCRQKTLTDGERALKRKQNEKDIKHSAPVRLVEYL